MLIILHLPTSVTRLGDLLHSRQLLKPVATIILPKSPPLLGNFVKVSKSFIFLVKSFLYNFYRHLATFFWSHCYLRNDAFIFSPHKCHSEIAHKKWTKNVISSLGSSSFFKRAIPSLFFVYFCLFEQLLQFWQQINVKNVHPVYGVEIRTYNPQHVSPPITTRPVL